MVLITRYIAPVQHLSTKDEFVFKPEPNARKEVVLEQASHHTMVGMMSQMSALSMRAYDMFSNLLQESKTCYERINNLSERLDNINKVVPQVEQIFAENDLPTLLANPRAEFHLQPAKQPLHFGHASTMPYPLRSVYSNCYAPPPLQKMDPYMDDPSKKCMEFYTNPDFFLNQWIIEQQKQIDEAKKDRKKRKEAKKKRRAAQAGQQQEDTLGPKKPKRLEKVEYDPITGEKIKKPVQDQPQTSVPTHAPVASTLNTGSMRGKMSSLRPPKQARDLSRVKSVEEVPQEPTSRDVFRTPSYDQAYAEPTHQPPPPPEEEFVPPPPDAAFDDEPPPPPPPDRDYDAGEEEDAPPLPDRMPASYGEAQQYQPQQYQIPEQYQQQYEEEAPPPVAERPPPPPVAVPASTIPAPPVAAPVAPPPPAMAPPPPAPVPPPPGAPPPPGLPPPAAPAGGGGGGMLAGLANVQLKKAEKIEKPVDARSDLLTRIRGGIALKKASERKVPDKKEDDQAPKSIADILSRRIAVAGDSDSDSDDDDDDDWDD